MIPSAGDLHNFLIIADRKNLTRAAERIGMSQPALSQTLQRLEQAIGAEIFIRTKRGVELTQAGRQLQIRAKVLLEDWEDIRKSARASVNEIQGIYTIGCHPSVARYSLGSFLPQLLVEHKKLEIKLVHDLSRRITEKVISLEVDIGIVVNPVQHPDLVIHQLCKDEVSFWTKPGSASSDILICDPELIQSQTLIKKAKRSGMSFDRIVHSSNLEVVLQLVHDGIGIGILPSRVAKSSNGSSLKKVPDSPKFEDEICLVYRTEKRSIRSIQEIKTRIIQAFC